MGRGGDDLVSALAQIGDGLRADQAGAADDDDFQGFPPELVPTLAVVRKRIVRCLRQLSKSLDVLLSDDRCSRIVAQRSIVLLEAE